MRFDGVQLKKEDEIKRATPQMRITSQIKTKTDTQSLAGLISLSKELKNPKTLTQMKNLARNKKVFGGIMNKFERDFKNIRRKYSNILTAKPGFELRIKRRRPRKLIERYYVSASAAEGGDGSQNQPFRTITQALERAAELDHVVLYINIASGSYTENLEITRDTHLTGTSVFLWGSIENSNHHLNLTGIHMRNPVGYGIRQTGGTLIMESCSVLGTSNVASDSESGTGLHLSNGTEALLTLSCFVENQGREIWKRITEEFF